MDNLLKGMILFPLNLLYRISPRAEIALLFRIKQGYPLNLRSPKTFNEKLQWIKLNVHNPLMTKCCDKYHVRQVVTDLGCPEILNELLWSGYNPEDIPFDELPNEFVIKATHGSNFNIICQDKSKINRNNVVKQCKSWLKTKFLPCYGEWFYGVVKPRIIIEKFIKSNDDKQLIDYKILCFHGEPQYIRVDVDRFTNHRHDVYLPNWKRLEGVHLGKGCSTYALHKPKCLDALLEYARKLSKSFLHARIDFYIVDDKVIFGEMTFTNGAGFDRFSSYDFDLEVGSHLELPN